MTVFDAALTNDFSSFQKRLILFVTQKKTRFLLEMRKNEFLYLRDAFRRLLNQTIIMQIKTGSKSI